MPEERFLGHPVAPVTATHPCERDIRLVGKHVTLVKLQAGHATSLFSAVGGSANATLWDFMLSGPFPDRESFDAYVAARVGSRDPTFVVILANGLADASTPEGLAAVGMSSLHRVDVANGVVEVGNVVYGGALGRSRGATEAQYLLARHAFETLAFRRYEWKANALNAASARAARRLGFVFEGTFRQHMVVKGRSRDSVWFSIIDAEWDAVKKALEAWLDDSNFDAEGRQRKRLEEFRA